MPTIAPPGVRELVAVPNLGTSLARHHPPQPARRPDGPVTTPVRAQPAWPERPITLVHGLAPGGPSDIIARIIAEGLSRRLGQQVVVDARPGAGGRVAAAQIAKVAPDGYTLMGIPSGHAVAAALYKTLSYRTIDDFTMISMLTEYPFVAVTNAEGPIRTLPDLIDAARARGTPCYSAAPATARCNILPASCWPRRSTPSSSTCRIAAAHRRSPTCSPSASISSWNSPTAELEFIRAGKVRALAVTGTARFFSLPEVPTTAEAGLPGYTFTSWQGLVAPAGLAAAIVQRLNAEIAGLLAEPETVERIKLVGNLPSPSSPEAFKARIAADIDKWTKVVDAANIERI